MVRLPPRGIASLAFTARFISTCSICPASAYTGGRFRSSATVSLNIFSKKPFEHHFHVLEDGVEINDFRFQHLFPAEGEELAGDGGGAVHGLPDFQNILAPEVLLVHCRKQQLAVPHDAEQHVVEVVRDSPGKLANAFHLLRVEQLLLKLPDLRNIGDHHERAKKLAVVASYRRQIDKTDSMFAVRTDELRFIRRNVLPLRFSGKRFRGLQLGLVRQMRQFHVVLSDCILACAADQVRASLIDVQDSALRIQQDNRFRRRFEYCAIPVVVLPQQVIRVVCALDAAFPAGAPGFFLCL